MMFLQQLVRTVIYTEVPVDPFALDIGIVPVEIYDRMPEIPDGNTVSAERSGTVPELLL